MHLFSTCIDFCACLCVPILCACVDAYVGLCLTPRARAVPCPPCSSACFVLDLGEAGDLYTALYGDPDMSTRPRATPFGEARVRSIMVQLVLALEHLHARSVVHRDIKPENVVVCHDGSVRLTDFGLAKVLDSPRGRTLSNVGTTIYKPPEILCGEAHGVAVDWWQLGALMFEMLFARPPYAVEEPSARLAAMRDAPLTIPPLPEVSAEAADLMRRLLSFAQWNRPRDAAAVRAHPFFAGVDFEAIVRAGIPLSRSTRDLTDHPPRPLTPPDDTCGRFRADPSVAEELLGFAFAGAAGTGVAAAASGGTLLLKAPPEVVALTIV